MDFSTHVTYQPPATIGQSLYVGTGRVVNPDGKSIAAGFFYVDANGARLSQDFVTDADGSFHWAIDDTSAPSTFINFYSTTDYVPIVLTPDELLNNSTVVLPYANKQPASNVLPWVLGAGVVAIVLSHKPRKKIGATFVERAKSKYKALSPTQKKILLYGGGGIAAYFLIKYLLGYKPTPGQTAEISAAKSKLAQLAAEFGILPTLSDTEFATMANNIVTAVNDCGTDEDAIVAQMQKINNEADIYKFIIVYDVRGYKGCFEGSYFGDVHHTLSETLHADMSQYWIDKINNILESKNITYAF